VNKEVFQHNKSPPSDNVSCLEKLLCVQLEDNKKSVLYFACRIRGFKFSPQSFTSSKHYLYYNST